MNGSLEISLQQASSAAVEEARQIGEAALPTVEKYSMDEDYKKRQTAVACASVIDGEGAGRILAAGLTDANVNVRSTAAKALKANPHPAATEAVLERLENSQEEVLRQTLALAAGKLPGEKTIAVLKKLETADEGLVSVNAQMALAKLGDGEAKQAIMKQLEDPLPRTRYDALEKLIYVNDLALARYIRRLLGDKSPAVTIGSLYNPKDRRVCDQAVDTLIFLLRLAISFRANTERIYTDQEISEVESLTR